jgi:hypothetical protein
MTYANAWSSLVANRVADSVWWEGMSLIECPQVAGERWGAPGGHDPPANGTLNPFAIISLCRNPANALPGLPSAVPT